MKNILLNIVLPIFMVLLVVGALGKGCAVLIEFDAKQQENAKHNPRVTVIDDTTIEIGFLYMVNDEERAAFIRRNNYEVKSASRDRGGNYVYIVTAREVKDE